MITYNMLFVCIPTLSGCQKKYPLALTQNSNFGFIRLSMFRSGFCYMVNEELSNTQTFYKKNRLFAYDDPHEFQTTINFFLVHACLNILGQKPVGVHCTHFHVRDEKLITYLLTYRLT